jgi:hypothetical protein
MASEFQLETLSGVLMLGTLVHEMQARADVRRIVRLPLPRVALTAWQNCSAELLNGTCPLSIKDGKNELVQVGALRVHRTRAPHPHVRAQQTCSCSRAQHAHQSAWTYLSEPL